MEREGQGTKKKGEILPYVYYLYTVPTDESLRGLGGPVRQRNPPDKVKGFEIKILTRKIYYSIINGPISKLGNQDKDDRPRGFV